MNYIISSIVLLCVIIIIIYILSVDNNLDKLKNKLKEMFKVVGSKDINYLNDTDSAILLKFLKSKFNDSYNILIPKKIYYIKDDSKYIMKDINIIKYKFIDDSITETNSIINIKFIPIKNELFIGEYTLFGLNGTYYIETIQEDTDKPKSSMKKTTNVIKKENPIENPIKNTVKKVTFNNNSTTLNSSDMIPDIISVSSNSEKNITESD